MKAWYDVCRSPPVRDWRCSQRCLEHMRRFVFRYEDSDARVRVRLLAVAIMIASGVARAMPITYDLSFGSGTPDQLTGSITTDGHIGAIFDGNVLGWSFHSVGTVPFTISGVGLPSPPPGLAATGCLDGGGSCFTAGLDFLSFNFQATGASFFGLSTDPTFCNCGLSIIGPRPPDFEVGRVLVGNTQFFPLLSYPLPVSGVVGIARGSLPVPEPTPLAILGLALAGCLAFKRRRFRGSSPLRSSIHKPL